MSAVATSRAVLGAVAFAVCLMTTGGCQGPPPPVPRATATLGVLPQLTDEEARGLVSLPWEPAGGVPAGAQIMVSVPDAQCDVLIGSQARSSPVAVAVAVLGRRSTCTAVREKAIVVVQLPEALGTRAVAHAPVDPATASPG